jgi:hypothetical protein
VAVILPVLTIVYASFQHLGAVAPRWSNFTLANYATALSLDAVRSGAVEQPAARASPPRASASC